MMNWAQAWGGETWGKLWSTEAVRKIGGVESPCRSHRNKGGFIAGETDLWASHNPSFHTALIIIASFFPRLELKTLIYISELIFFFWPWNTGKNTEKIFQNNCREALMQPLLTSSRAGGISGSKGSTNMRCSRPCHSGWCETLLFAGRLRKASAQCQKAYTGIAQELKSICAGTKKLQGKLSY